MATDVERLAVLIEANTKSYEKAMEKVEQRTQRALAKVERQYKDSGAKIDAFLSKAGSRFAAALTIGAVVKGLHDLGRAVKEVAKIGDLSDRLGVTTDTLQALNYELSQNGGEADSAEKSLTKFSDALGEAANGGGYLLEVFQQNNVALRDQNGHLRSTEDLLEDFSKIVAGTTSHQEKLMLVTEAFGRSAGPQMLMTLEQIASRGLGAVTKAAKDTGVVIDKELVAKAQDFDDAWDKATTIASTNIKSFIITAISELEKFFNKITATKEELQKLGAAPGTMDFAIPPHEQGLTPDGRPSIVVNGGQGGFVPPLPRSKPRQSVIPSRASGGNKLDDLERNLKRMREQVALMEKEAEVIDLGTYARERAMIVTKLETAAKEANVAAGLKNVDVTEAQRAKIEEMADAYAAAAVGLEQARGPLREFAREGANTALQLQDALVSALQGFEDKLVEAVMTGKLEFKDLANSIIADMARIAIRSAITAPLAGALGGLFGGGGIFGGFRAAGGPVSPGKMYMVGENGPEPFIPSTAGRIMSNRDMRSMGAPSVSMSVSIDARGADQGAVVRIGQAVDNLKKTLPQLIDARQMNRQTRGVRA